MARTPQPDVSAQTFPAYPLPDHKPGWRLMLGLALGLALLYFVTALPIAKSDAATRSAYALTATLAADHTSQIDNFARTASGTFLTNPADFPNAAYYQGHFYTDAAPGASLLALPFQQFGRVIGNLSASFSPTSNAPLDAPAALSLLAMALAGAGVVLVVYASALRIGATEISSRYAALTVGLASLLWREAGRFAPPVVSLLLLTAALYLALPPLPRHQQNGENLRMSLPRTLLLGFLLGLAVTTDYANLIFTPIFVIYLFTSGRLTREQVGSQKSKLSIKYQVSSIKDKSEIESIKLEANSQPATRNPQLATQKFPPTTDNQQPTTLTNPQLATSSVPSNNQQLTTNNSKTPPTTLSYFLLPTSYLFLGLFFGLAPLLLYNWGIFGKPWAFTYGYLLGNPEARSLIGQFLSGFNFDSIRQIFFGDGRAVFGPFLIFLGLWGLVALYIQRGKRKDAILLFALILASLVVGLLRRPIGLGTVRADFVIGAVPPLAVGVAVWHQRFQFMTRMEQSWVPRLALWGVALYYLVAYPGPLLNNFGNLVYLWPFALLIAVISLIIRAARKPKVQRLNSKVLGTGLLAILLLFTIFSFTFSPSGTSAAFYGENSNILNYNWRLKCENQKLPGWYLSEPCQPLLPESGVKVGPNARLQPYLVGVQGGKSYNLSIQREPANAVFSVTWSWSDEGHQPLPGEFTATLTENNSFLIDQRAAPPGAAYLQLTIQQGSSPAAFRSINLTDHAPRLEPMKNYATAALSFSFDWESAMGGLIHSKGGASLAEGGDAAGVAISENDRQKAVANAEERGLMMRKGADNLLSFFQKYGISGTFYATGYNLLDGNQMRMAFAGNPVYKWANPNNLWANDYWTKHAWYGDDPYGTYQANPAWYFGDQASRLKQAGQDIQSHTFGHLYVRGTTPAEFYLDLEMWVRYAAEKGIIARSFAFPWKSSNSVAGPHYKILADAGFQSITRLYDGDQSIKQTGDGSLLYDNNKRDASNQRIYEPEIGPQNYYYYLNRVASEPRLLVLNDYQLVPADKSEAQAKSLIDQLLIRRGYGSIWTHPEAIVEPRDKAQWESVISYAASRREVGLWVDSVTNLVQHRLDIQKIGVETAYSDDNRRTRLTMTLTNNNNHAVEGLTLTLPGQINQITRADGTNYPNFKGAQFVAPKLEASQATTLIVYLNK